MRTSIIKRLALALLLPALGISAFTGTVAAETGPVPHENPAGAAIRLDIAIALLHYSQIFEQVADRNYSEARALIEQIKPGQAHLPADIAFIMTRYNDLTTDLTERLDELDSTLDSCEQLLSQNRLDEAAVKLSQAGALANETAALMDGIGSATEELLLKIAPFISPGKAQEISNAQARLQEAMERLKELEAWCRDLLQHLQAVAEEKVKLSVSGLSLNTAPRELWLGEHVTLSGTLKAGDVPLPSRNVSILLEGGFFTSATTTADGTYETSFALPFRYTPHIRVQAFYAPQGDDRDSFTAASSAVREISALFYPSTLRIESPEKIYPGRPEEISGELISGASIAGRKVRVSLDNKLLFESTTGQNGLFRHGISVSAESAPGEHRLSFYVAPENETSTAGTSSERAINIVKITPQLEVHAPTRVFAPQKVGLEGKIHSPFPLQGAAVAVQIAGVSETSTIDEGGFELEFDLPFNPCDIGGSKEARVTVTPTEPWHLPTTQAANIFVINSIYLVAALCALITGIILLLVRIAGILPRRKKGFLLPWETLPTPESAPPVYLPEIRTEPGDYRRVVLKAYYIAAAGVQKLLGIFFKPQFTLREFLNRVGPSLGSFTRLFTRLSLLAEKALYSRHIPEPYEASLAQELASQMEKSHK